MYSYYFIVSLSLRFLTVVYMSLRKGTYLGIGALVAGGGGFWFQEELINRHRYSCEKRVDFKSESLFREYLACTYKLSEISP